MATIVKTSKLVIRDKVKGHIITPAGCEKITTLAANGNDRRTICRVLGLAASTFRDICKRDEAVDEALQAGRAALADELTSILLTHARKGNVTAAIFLSKARLGWRDIGPATGTTSNNVQVNIQMPPPMPESEFRKFVEASSDAKD